MAKAPPSFNFYYNDWIGGVQDLCAEDERHYLRLLIYQWQNGHIPKSKIAQMNVCGIVDVVKWDGIWGRIMHKFTPIDDPNDDSQTIFVQMRMHKDRENDIPKWLRAIEIREKRREAGKLGGRPKSKSKANAKAKRKQTKANLEEGRGNRDREVNKEVVSPPHSDPEYLTAWEAYLDVRRDKKYTMSAYAIKLLVGKLEKMDRGTGLTAIHNAITGAWKSFYIPDGDKETAEKEADTRRKAARIAQQIRTREEIAARKEANRAFYEAQ